MIKPILVNASGAKIGGAKTIIDTYLHWINENDSVQQYVFILGYKPSFKLNENIKVIYKPTSGIKTFIFSIFSIFIDVIKYKPDVLISFNNVNLLIPYVKRVTYFHQTKLFEPQFTIKKFLYDSAIKLLSSNTFITQSEFVKQRFLEKYPSYNVVAKWPGFSIPECKSGQVSKLCNKLKKTDNNILLVPITDIRMSHKNIELIYQYAKKLSNLDVEIIITSQQFNYPSESNIHFVGSIDRGELFYLYQIVDGVLFPSNAETVGLPIFEAASSGLPVWVLSKQYSQHFYHQFNEPKNFILFRESELIQHLHFDGRYTESPTTKYAKSDWSFT